jgi:ADP-ribose pyrophosphatase YjhB (NUDIX family)
MIIQDTSLQNAPVPAIGVGGIVFNDHNQVLLILRNQPPAQGLWSVPGGKQEANESLVEACVREVKEETGLDVQVKTIVAVVERRIEGFHYVIVDFLTELKSQDYVKPVASSDVSEVQWIDLANLADYAVVDGLLEIILRSFESYKSQSLLGLCKVNAQDSDFILPSL